MQERPQKKKRILKDGENYKRHVNAYCYIKIRRQKKSIRNDPPQLRLFKTRVNDALAFQIATYIDTMNISKQAFAKLVHQPPSALSRWLTGQHNFTIETLCEISFHTRIPITELLACHFLFKGYSTNPEFTALCERNER